MPFPPKKMYVCSSHTGYSNFPFYYAWLRRDLWGPAGCPLYKKRCRVIARGSMNSIMIEFEDGTRHVVSRNAVRAISSSRIERLPSKEQVIGSSPISPSIPSQLMLY